MASTGKRGTGCPTIFNRLKVTKSELMPPDGRQRKVPRKDLPQYRTTSAKLINFPGMVSLTKSESQIKTEENNLRKKHTRKTHKQKQIQESEEHIQNEYNKKSSETISETKSEVKDVAPLLDLKRLNSFYSAVLRCNMPRLLHKIASRLPPAYPSLSIQRGKLEF